MGWTECRCDAHWSRWMSKNYITRCRRKFELVGEQSLESVVAVWSSENQTQQRTVPAGPPVEKYCRMRTKPCYSQKSWGSICCSLCSVSNSPLTHNPFVPFRIKCERYIFLKNCVPSSLLCWICFCMFMSMLHLANVLKCDGSTGLCTIILAITLNFELKLLRKLWKLSTALYFPATG